MNTSNENSHSEENRNHDAEHQHHEAEHSHHEDRHHSHEEHHHRYPEKYHHRAPEVEHRYHEEDGHHYDPSHHPHDPDELWYDANEDFEHYGATFIPGFNQGIVQDIVTSIGDQTYNFREMSDRILRPRERRRKVGAGIRNFGFLVKTNEFAISNPQFAVSFNPESFNNCILNINDCRAIITAAQTLIRVVSDSMMTYSNEAYSFALLYYQTVRQLAARDVPGAREIFRQLQPFFRRPRRTGDEPTEAQVMRDVKGLMHGTKDGKIIVENEQPHTEGGKREVIDDTHKPKAGEFKETVEGVICSQCNTHNVAHARFCNGCGNKLVN